MGWYIVDNKLTQDGQNMDLGHISWMFGWSADVLMSHPWIHSGYRTSQWYSLRVGLANWQGRSMFGWMCGLAQVLSVWMQHLILLHIICWTYSAGNVFSSSVCWGLTFDIESHMATYKTAFDGFFCHCGCFCIHFWRGFLQPFQRNNLQREKLDIPSCFCCHEVEII